MAVIPEEVRTLVAMGLQEAKSITSSVASALQSYAEVIDPSAESLSRLERVGLSIPESPVQTDPARYYEFAPTVGKITVFNEVWHGFSAYWVSEMEEYDDKRALPHFLRLEALVPELVELNDKNSQDHTWNAYHTPTRVSDLIPLVTSLDIMGRYLIDPEEDGAITEKGEPKDNYLFT